MRGGVAMLSAYRSTTLLGRIQASGGARPRTEDSGQTAWCSRSIGMTKPMTRAIRAQRPHNVELDGAEVARDQKDDIVEVGVVIETTDPRLVRRAGLSGRRQRQ